MGHLVALVRKGVRGLDRYLTEQDAINEINDCEEFADEWSPVKVSLIDNDWVCVFGVNYSRMAREQ